MLPFGVTPDTTFLAAAIAAVVALAGLVYNFFSDGSIRRIQRSQFERDQWWTQYSWNSERIDAANPHLRTLARQNLVFLAASKWATKSQRESLLAIVEALRAGS